MIPTQVHTMEMERSERPRAVTIVGWVWLLAAALRFLNGLLALVVWKVGGLEREIPFVPRVVGMETIRRFAVPSIVVQILLGAAIAWAAFELLRLKSWARTVIVAASVVGILGMAVLGVYVYASTVRAASEAGVAAEQVRMAAIGAAAVITLVGAAFFGTTIFLLSGSSVRRAFGRAVVTRGRADFSASESADVLRAAVTRLSEGFEELPPSEARIPGGAEIARLLEEVAERLQNNYPYFHPLYAGQMLKPPHPVARLAYALAMWLNPNNHALDGGRESSRMEKEAVAEIARDVRLESAGVPRPPLRRRHDGEPRGALGGRPAPSGRRRRGVDAGALHPWTDRIACSAFPSSRSPATRRGRMDVRALERRLERGGVGTVVATIGTTATGSVDPLPEILALRERHGFRLHADAAYGGYFGLADNLAPEARRAYDRLREADSIVIDPHKHGLQPYGCGCVLFRDPAVGRFYKHDSPYTYFSSDELHLGEISLECSRPGASAVALWATQRLLPLEAGGEFAGGLTDCRAAALDFHAALADDARFLPAFRARARHRRLDPSGAERVGGLGPLPPDLRRGRAPESPSRARGAAGGVLRSRARRDRPRPRDGDLPALGADEARAPRVDVPDPRDPGRRRGRLGLRRCRQALRRLTLNTQRSTLNAYRSRIAASRPRITGTRSAAPGAIAIAFSTFERIRGFCWSRLQSATYGASFAQTNRASPPESKKSSGWSTPCATNEQAMSQ